MLVLLPLLTRWFFYNTTMNKKYVVYQHVTPDGMYYFGQTNNIKRRWRNNGAEYKGTALYPYIEKYGWENIQHIVLFRDQTKEDALFIEDFLIETAREDGVCINKNRSGLISKEEGYNQQHCKQYYETNKGQAQERHKMYYETNKGQILEQQKQYYEDNKGKIKEQQKQYREQNKDKIKQYYETNKGQILEQQKQYYEDNKDKILEQKRQYYEQNRDKIREYKRQRYQRKKLEKQLKEVETTPLF